MFLEEQKARYRELRRDWDGCDGLDNFIERLVWSPVSCRFTSWTYRSLCRTDERGRIIRGSRQRDLFRNS